MRGLNETLIPSSRPGSPHRAVHFPSSAHHRGGTGGPSDTVECSGTIQMQRELPVTRRERQGQQLLRSNPGVRRVLDAPRVARDLHRVELDDEGRARVVNGELHLADRLHGDVQLLGELAAGSFERALSFLELPAGELPEATVPLVRWSLADEEAAIAADDGGDDADGGGCRHLVSQKREAAMSA